MSRTERTATEPPAKTDADTSVADECTAREQVWDATLDLLARRPLPFQAWRVRKRAGLSDAQDRTIRRALSSMDAAGWLEHEKGSKWWHPGPKADEHLHE